MEVIASPRPRMARAKSLAPHKSSKSSGSASLQSATTKQDQIQDMRVQVLDHLAEKAYAQVVMTEAHIIYLKNTYLQKHGGVQAREAHGTAPQRQGPACFSTTETGAGTDKSGAIIQLVMERGASRNEAQRRQQVSPSSELVIQTCAGVGSHAGSSLTVARHSLISKAHVLAQPL